MKKKGQNKVGYKASFSFSMLTIPLSCNNSLSFRSACSTASWPVLWWRDSTFMRLSLSLAMPSYTTKNWQSRETEAIPSRSLLIYISLMGLGGKPVLIPATIARTSGVKKISFSSKHRRLGRESVCNFSLYQRCLLERYNSTLFRSNITFLMSCLPNTVRAKLLSIKILFSFVGFSSTGSI